MNKLEDEPKSGIRWHAQTAEFALNHVGSRETGLTTEEANERLKRHGENVLPQKKPKSIFVMFLEELINPIILILLVAVVFSFIISLVRLIT